MLKDQIQKIKQVRQASKPPFNRLSIGAKIYEVIDFRKNRVKGRKGHRWQTDRSQIFIKHLNTEAFSYLSSEPTAFNIALDDLVSKNRYGYSEVKFYNDGEEDESK